MFRKLPRLILLIITIGVVGFAGYQIFMKGEKPAATEAMKKEKTQGITEDDVFPVHYDVPTDKSWTISFDEPLDPNTITEQNVFVNDEDGKTAAVKVSLNNENDSVFIEAPEGGYSKGGYYELHMTDKVGYAAGGTVSKSFKMGFLIARDKVTDIVFNKEIIAVKKEAIESDEKPVLVLNKENAPVELEKGDILKIPSDHEVFEEKAVKITEIDENIKNITIQYTEPSFQELFEKFNLYESFDLTGEDVIFKPAEGVEMNKLALGQPNTLLASSKSKKAAKGGEYQLDKEKATAGLKFADGIEFTLKDLAVKVEGQETTLSGTYNILEPKTVWDVDLDLTGVKKLNAQLTTSNQFNIQQSLEIKEFDKKFFKKFKKEVKGKKWNNDKWLFDKEVRLGAVYLPIFPGVFLEGNISGVFGINPLTGEATLKETHFISGSTETNVGVMKKKDKYKPVFNPDIDMDAGIHINGSGEAKLTGELQFGITALEIMGLGLEAEGGGYAAGEGFLGSSVKNSTSCYKFDYGAVLGGGIVLEALLKEELLGFKLNELKIPIGEKNTCLSMTGIEILPKKVEAKPGETIELKINGKYFDESNSQTTSENLLTKENLKKLEVTTEDQDTADIKIRVDKDAVPASEIGEEVSKEGIKLKLYPEKYYKVLVKIPKEPLEDQTTIKVEFDGGKDTFTKEIPVELKDVAKKVSNEEAKKIVNELMSGIVNTFVNSGEVHNWNEYDNPVDFSVLRPELLKYASKNFTNGFLKDTADDYYCQCDQRFFPDINLDVRFTVHENTRKKIVASGIEFFNDMGNGGNTVHLTVIRKDGKWVMDDIKWVPYTKEPMNVTWEEIKAYEAEYKTPVELLNETQYNGRKLYVIKYPENDVIQGKYADSTEIMYEVPEELLPKEEQAAMPSNSFLDGIWTLDKSVGIAEGKLTISNATDAAFDFDIFVENSQQNFGEITGTASVQDDSASFSESEYGCELQFSLDGDTININQSAGCEAWGGFGVYFEGAYKPK